MSRDDGKRLNPDAEELILCQDERYTCETYVFEPAAHEAGLGYLFAAAETENRDGIGSELIDTIISAIQKEYYRDGRRSAEAAFEMALHQANLILHDASEAGMRDWMGYFHISVACLVGEQLHISVAGGGKVWLARAGQLVNVSAGLGHSPITNALQTFSQIASGDLTDSDTIFLTTAHFDSLFRPVDVTRFALDHNATTISARLAQLYQDQNQYAPLALVTVSLLPDYMAQKRPQTGRLEAPHEAARIRSGVSQANIQPRKPLIIRRSTLKNIFLFISQVAATLGKLFLTYVWPVLKVGSAKGGRAIVSASKSTGKGVYSLAARRFQKVGGESFSEGAVPAAKPHISLRLKLAGILAWVLEVPARIMGGFRRLPVTSKIFAVVSVVLVAALVVSLFLLREKRTSDQAIVQASEVLHEAQTKKDAAETAMIYDNRDQANSLLDEARTLASQLATTGLYQEETAGLLADIQTQTDRLQRVTRVGPEQVRELANMSDVLSGKPPEHVFFVDGSLYTYDPDNNAIIRVEAGGEVSIVHETTQGIGFIAGGVVHPSDKTITLATDPTGVAVFDTKDASLTSQDISFAPSDPQISDLAVFGNRLYVLDAGADQIFSYNKTLRGYSSSSPWITDSSFPSSTMTSLAVDGNVFTLHSDGAVRRLFKGANSEFSLEKIEPSLSSATQIRTNDALKYLYILDPSNKRVVILDKQGALIQQLFVDSAESVVDVAVAPDESKLYVLDGTRIMEIVLSDSAAAQ